MARAAPMRSSFLDFLLESRSSSSLSLEAVRRSVPQIREPIGTLARRQGLISDEGVARILQQQRRDGRPFGELAARLGLVGPAQVRSLLQLQRLAEAVRVAELLASSGQLSLDEAIESLGQFFLDAGLKDRIATFEQALRAAERRAQGLEAELARLRASDAESGRTRIQAAEREARRAREERDGAQGRFEAREKVVEAQRRRAADAESRARFLERALAQVEERSAEERRVLTWQLEQARTKERGARRAAEQAHARCSGLEGASAETAERAAAFERTLEQFRRDLGERDVQLRAVRGELAAERESRDDFIAGSARVRALESELAAARDRASEAEQELDAERRRRRAAEGELNVLREVEESVQRYADRLEERLRRTSPPSRSRAE